MTPQTTIWGDDCRVIKHPTTVESLVASTSSIIPPSATTTAGTNPGSSNSSPSSSNTGAMVGDVVGGVVDLFALILTMKRPEGGVVGGMFPDIAVNDDHPTSLMSQLGDDGMGNQLNASTVRKRNCRSIPTPPSLLSLPYFPNLPCSSHHIISSGEGNPNGFNRDKDQKDIPRLDLRQLERIIRICFIIMVHNPPDALAAAGLGAAGARAAAMYAHHLVGG
ncbi:hypothetical protein K435DRAFT_861891 [Dendrothele bispora CBS 962.96]|uniref:Uncharacterized protein n=1 Tax=Dendrothele bispora (strain CBS 962.96) TaxID=1314807 RepID=A0A4V4HEZ9_DENBC|nr:hypothetical protein K435DRAFT_861891 [Dendrothele bispora CBS 962.96]